MSPVFNSTSRPAFRNAWYPQFLWFSRDLLFNYSISYLLPTFKCLGFYTLCSSESGNTSPSTFYLPEFCSTFFYCCHLKWFQWGAENGACGQPTIFTFTAKYLFPITSSFLYIPLLSKKSTDDDASYIGMLPRKRILFIPLKSEKC